MSWLNSAWKHEANSSRHFDEVASTWVNRYETVPSFRARLRVVVTTAKQLLSVSHSARVLDLGSGPGVLGLAVSASASVVICADTSWAMLHAGEMAEARIGDLVAAMGFDYRRDAVIRVAGSAAAIAGAAQCPFDLVLAVSVLEYQRDPSVFLQEVVELVRPGGFILFTVPYGPSVIRRIERPVDAVAAVVGRLLGVNRLANRSYSANRPFGSDVPWRRALAEIGAARREVIPLPLGHSGVRAALCPNVLVVAQLP